MFDSFPHLQCLPSVPHRHQIPLVTLCFSLLSVCSTLNFRLFFCTVPQRVCFHTIGPHSSNTPLLLFTYDGEESSVLLLSLSVRQALGLVGVFFSVPLSLLQLQLWMHQVFWPLPKARVTKPPSLSGTFSVIAMKVPCYLWIH